MYPIIKMFMIYNFTVKSNNAKEKRESCAINVRLIDCLLIISKIPYLIQNSSQTFVEKKIQILNPTYFINYVFCIF